MKPKKIIKKIHLWIALLLFLPFLIQGLSGAIIVFEEQISEFSAQEKNHEVAQGDIKPIEDIIASAQNILPKQYAISSLKLPLTSDDAATLRFNKKDSPSIEVLIDAVSLQIIDQRNINDNAVLRIIHKMHTNFLIEGKTGRNIVGFFGVMMLCMIISGVIIWIPKNKSLFKAALTFRFSDTGFNFHRNMHRSVGIWSLPILFIISFSGVYIAFPQFIEPAISNVFPARHLRSNRVTIQAQKNKEMIPVTQAVDIAKDVFKEEQLLSISFPRRKNSPYRISLKPQHYIQGAPVINVFIDPVKAKIIEIHDTKNFTLGEKIMAWQLPLHKAEAFGMSWKITSFFAGFLPILFAITGMTMWLKKKKVKKLH